MDWLILTLISLAVGVVVSVFDKYTLSRASASSYLFLIGVVNAFSLLFIPLGVADNPSVSEWAMGLLLGILFAAIIYATFRAFQQEEVSRLVPLGILSTILISVGSAVFFAERLTVQQYWAFGLFIIGAFFLATRIEYKVELLEDISNFKIHKVGRQVQRAAQSAFSHPYKTSRKVSKQMLWTMYDIFETEWQSPVVSYLKYKRKLKLIKGLGWYLLAIGLAIPYTLFAKQHNTLVGVTTGFMTIRVGLFVGSCLFVCLRWNEFVHFMTKKTKLFAVAGVKELVSVCAGFLWWAAVTTGPLSIILSLGSLQAAAVFVLTGVLSYFGIMHESLKRRDLLQKSVGVLFVTVATILLFV
jgi:uncharacterized membrane protein